MIFNPSVSGGGNSIPTGVICMWSGSADAIPSGWALCDGTNNTPDLRGRFIVGAGDAYSVGDTGGTESVTLTTAQMPSHSHSGSGTAASAGAHVHNLPDCITGTGAYGINWTQVSRNYNYPTIDTGEAGAHTHTLNISIGSTGSGEAHENRPPYYALCYIMKQ